MAKAIIKINCPQVFAKIIFRLPRLITLKKYLTLKQLIIMFCVLTTILLKNPKKEIEKYEY